MNRVILQVPMPMELKKKAEAAVTRLGFSSLQESIRVWLTHIVRQTPILRWEEPPVELSPKAIRRYNTMIDDMDTGRVKTKSFTSVAALMKELRS